MNVRAIAMALSIGCALAVVACSDDDEPNPGALPTPTSEAPLPESGIVYAYLVDGPEGSEDATYRIDTFYDGDVVASFDVTGVVGYPSPSVLLAGDEVLVNHSDRVTSYALDGSDQQVLHAPDGNGYVAAFDVSHNARTLAVIDVLPSSCAEQGGNCFPPHEYTRLLFIDMETGDIVREMRQADPPLDALPGYAQHVYWWNDGSRVAVHGVINNHTMGGIANVSARGDVRVSEVSDFQPERPDGQLLATGERLESCDLNINRIEMAIVDLADDTVLASARDESRLVSDRHWSPDGGELLFSTVTFIEQPAAQTLGEGAEGICRIRHETTAKWSVLHSDGSPRELDVDEFAVIDRWSGGNPILFICDGQRVFDPRYCIAGGQRSPTTVTYEGTTIATTTDFRFLGELP